MNTFGRFFRIHIFGESHGVCAGVCVDGCPPGIAIAESDFEEDLARRRPGKKGTTTRVESDKPKIVSGFFKGFTTGAPIVIIFDNQDTRSGDYSQFVDMPRPGHADFVAGVKYKGFNDYRGSGHFSGRISVGLAAAGVIAKKIVAPANISSRICEIGGSSQWEDTINKCISEGDSVGGIIECLVDGLAVGLGEPFFDSVESLIAHAVFSIPAVKGIEFGAGFAAARMRGSCHNDILINEQGKTATNNAGGINGGITNGNQLVFRVAVKPTSTIAMQQQTINLATGEMATLQAAGRHDNCIALRMPPIIEATTAIALANLVIASRYPDDVVGGKKNFSKTL